MFNFNDLTKYDDKIIFEAEVIDLNGVTRIYKFDNNFGALIFFNKESDVAELQPIRILNEKPLRIKFEYPELAINCNDQFVDSNEIIVVLEGIEKLESDAE